MDIFWNWTTLGGGGGGGQNIKLSVGGVQIFSGTVHPCSSIISYEFFAADGSVERDKRSGYETTSFTFLILL